MIEIETIKFENISSQSNAISGMKNENDYKNNKLTHLTTAQNNKIGVQHWIPIDLKDINNYGFTHCNPFVMGTNPHSLLVPKLSPSIALLKQYNIDLYHIDFPTNRADIICKNIFNAHDVIHNITDPTILADFINKDMLLAKPILWSESPELFMKKFGLTKEPANDSIHLELPLTYKPFVENINSNMIAHFIGMHQQFDSIDSSAPMIDLIIGNKMADVVGNKYTISQVIYSEVPSPVIYITPNMKKRENEKYFNAYKRISNDKIGFVTSRNFYIPGKSTDSRTGTINITKGCKMNYQFGLLERAKDEESFDILCNLLLESYMSKSEPIWLIVQTLRRSYERIIQLIKNKDFPYDPHMARVLIDIYPAGNNPIINKYYESFLAYIECPASYGWYPKKDIYNNIIYTPCNRFLNIFKYITNIYESKFSDTVTKEFLTEIGKEFLNVSINLYKKFQHPKDADMFYIEAVFTETPDKHTVYIPRQLMKFFEGEDELIITGNPIHNADGVQVVKYLPWDNHVLGVCLEMMEDMGRDFDGDQLGVAKKPKGKPLGIKNNIITPYSKSIASKLISISSRTAEELKVVPGMIINIHYKDLERSLNKIISFTAIIGESNPDFSISHLYETEIKEFAAGYPLEISLVNIGYDVSDLINKDSKITLHETKYIQLPEFTGNLSINAKVKSTITTKNLIGPSCVPWRVIRCLANSLEELKEANHGYFEDANIIINTKTIDVLSKEFGNYVKNGIEVAYQKAHLKMFGENYKLPECAYDDRHRIVGKQVRESELNEQFLMGARNLITMTKSDADYLIQFIDNMSTRSFAYKQIRGILVAIFYNKNEEFEKNKENNDMIESLLSVILGYYSN